MNASVSYRFWNKVNKTETCWIWRGAHSKFGHGRFKIKNHLFSPHRLVFEWFVGVIPNGMLVCHKCDVPACVRPEHLFLGTYTDNLKDAISKNRRQIPKPLKGEKSHLSKLTYNEVVRLRELNENSLLKKKEIASLFNISGRNFRDIAHYRTWKV